MVDELTGYDTMGIFEARHWHGEAAAQPLSLGPLWQTWAKFLEIQYRYFVLVETLVFFKTNQCFFVTFYGTLINFVFSLFSDFPTVLA